MPDSAPPPSPDDAPSDAGAVGDVLAQYGDELDKLSGPLASRDHKKLREELTNLLAKVARGTTRGSGWPPWGLAWRVAGLGWPQAWVPASC